MAKHQKLRKLAPSGTQFLDLTAVVLLYCPPLSHTHTRIRPNPARRRLAGGK